MEGLLLEGNRNKEIEDIAVRPYLHETIVILQDSRHALDAKTMESAILLAGFDFSLGIAMEVTVEVVLHFDRDKRRFPVDDQGNDPLFRIVNLHRGFDGVGQSVVQEGIGIVVA